MRIIAWLIEHLGSSGERLATWFMKRAFGFAAMQQALRRVALSTANASTCSSDASSKWTGWAGGGVWASVPMDERPVPGRQPDLPPLDDCREMFEAEQVQTVLEHYVDACAALSGTDERPRVHRAARYSCVALRRAYRDRRMTPTALLGDVLACHERMHQRPWAPLGPSPFSVVDTSRARAAAAAATARHSSQPPSPLSPLDGILVPVKDSVDLREFPTESGVRAAPIVQRAGADRPAVDALVAQRLTAAGAIVLGKTCMTEYGMDALGTSTYYLMPRCAYHPELAAGGSSTGAAAAVARTAALHVPVAHGTDGGGSIRIPSAWNALFGFKPTHGMLVPRRGDNGIANSTVADAGALAVSVADVVAFLVAVSPRPSAEREKDVSGGTTARIDPASPHARIPPCIDDAGEGYAPPGTAARIVAGMLHALQRVAQPPSSPSPLRIGVPYDLWAACDSAAIRTAGLAALERLQDAGVAQLHPVRTDQLPLLPHVAAIGAITFPQEALESMAHYAWDGTPLSRLYNPVTRMVLAAARGLRADEVAQVKRARAALRHQMARWFAVSDAHVLALPTVGTPPIRYRWGDTCVQDAAATCHTVRYTFLGNLTGLPAGTAPVGIEPLPGPGRRDGHRAPVGAPIGLQFVGDAYHDAEVIRALALVERWVPLPALPTFDATGEKE